MKTTDNYIVEIARRRFDTTRSDFPASPRRMEMRLARDGSCFWLSPPSRNSIKLVDCLIPVLFSGESINQES